jgi:hypothetical protein
MPIIDETTYNKINQSGTVPDSINVPVLNSVPDFKSMAKLESVPDLKVREQ